MCLKSSWDGGTDVAEIVNMGYVVGGLRGLPGLMVLAGVTGLMGLIWLKLHYS